MNDLTPHLRQLTLSVCDGHMEVGSVLYHFSKSIYYEKILVFFLQAKITGEDFLDYYKNHFQCRWLPMLKWAVKYATGEKEIQDVVNGKNFFRNKKNPTIIQ